MKKFLRTIIIIIVTVIALVAVVRITRKDEVEQSEPMTFTITYKGVDEETGEIFDLSDSFFRSTGSYPVSAYEGDEIHVDDLEGVFIQHEFPLDEDETIVVWIGGISIGDDDYFFKGWYVESSCTFSFIQGTTIRGDMTLYARFDVDRNCWTKAY